MKPKSFTACPPDVLAAVQEAECRRLCKFGEADSEEVDPWWWAKNVVVGYVEDYSTDFPGYVGPVVILLWPADPGAVTIYMQDGDKNWVFCNQTSW